MAMEMRQWMMVPDMSVTEYGTIILFLKRITIEMTVDGGVYINDRINSIQLAISKDGVATSMIHPKGNMFGTYSRVETQVNHRTGIRYAKMWEKGISFTTDDRAVTFLADAGGVKTTVDWFLIFDTEFVNRAFYFGSRYGPSSIGVAFNLMNLATYWTSHWGQKNWKIGNIRISETSDGFVKVYGCNNSFQLRISFDRLLINTTVLHCTASLGENGHIFVRHENSRMHYDGNLFVIRHEGQSAGIDKYNNVHVY